MFSVYDGHFDDWYMFGRTIHGWYYINVSMFVLAGVMFDWAE